MILVKAWIAFVFAFAHHGRKRSGDDQVVVEAWIWGVGRAWNLQNHLDPDFFLCLQASVEGNVPFREGLAGESQKQFHEQGEPHQSELARRQQECTLKVEEV